MGQDLVPLRSLVPVDELDLPAWMPGDEVKYAVKGVYLYDPAGNPISTDNRDQALRWSELTSDPDNSRVELFSGAWGSFEVLTVYLGLNHSLIFVGGPGKTPLMMYETMIFGVEDSYTVARYGSRAAAWHGHDVVVAAFVRAMPGVEHTTVVPPGLAGWADQRGWMSEAEPKELGGGSDVFG